MMVIVSYFHTLLMSFLIVSHPFSYACYALHSYFHAARVFMLIRQLYVLLDMINSCMSC